MHYLVYTKTRLLLITTSKAGVNNTTFSHFFAVRSQGSVSLIDNKSSKPMFHFVFFLSISTRVALVSSGFREVELVLLY